MSRYNSQSEDAYAFDFNGTEVTAVYEFEDGRLEVERISSDENWSFDGNAVTKTEYEHGVIETSIFTDIDGDGLYTIVSKSYGSTISHHDNDDDSRSVSGYEYSGSSDDDDLYGSGGDDTLYADKGDDHIYGQDGDDIIIGSHGDDVYDGGTGLDTLKYSSATAGITVNLKAGIARATVESGDAGIGNDSFVNVENVFGGDYSDFLLGSGEDNTLIGNSGDDQVYAKGGDDKLEGRSDSDMLFGGAGKDTLKGGAGADELQGGAGKDVLYGGNGADTFVFTATRQSSATATSADVIKDFIRGTDTIDLSAIDASTKLSGNNTFTFDGTTTFGTSSYGEVYYKKFDLSGTSNDYTMVYIDTDNDPAAEMTIKLMGLHNLTASDFVL